MGQEAMEVGYVVWDGQEQAPVRVVGQSQNQNRTQNESRLVQGAVCVGGLVWLV